MCNGGIHVVYKLYDDWEEWITSFIQLKELVDAGEKKYNSFRDNFGLYIKYPSPVTLLRKRIGFYSLSHFKKTLSDFGIEEVLLEYDYDKNRKAKFDETVKEFVKALNDLIDANELSHAEIEEELKDKIDYINAEKNRIITFEESINKIANQRYTIVCTNPHRAYEKRRNGEINEAIKLQEEVVRYDPDNYESLKELTILYRQKADFDNEIRCCKAILKSSSKKDLIDYESRIRNAQKLKEIYGTVRYDECDDEEIKEALEFILVAPNRFQIIKYLRKRGPMRTYEISECINVKSLTEPIKKLLEEDLIYILNPNDKFKKKYGLTEKGKEVSKYIG